MEITGKNYVAPEAIDNKIASATKGAIKTYIKTLIPDDGKMEVNDLVELTVKHYAESDKHYTNDQIHELVMAVKEELNPTPEVVEEEITK